MAKIKEEYKLSPEIEKLGEKLAKDPSSKMFLPLAEEYAKGGMLEEALTVLKDGLKHHPGYVSARVALGKVYQKKGLLKEALNEFKKVISANADNILVHKKLAEIHQKLGNIQDAIKSCNTVILLNPKDEEIKAMLKQLEVSAPAAPRAAEKPVEAMPYAGRPAIEKPPAEKPIPEKPVVEKPEAVKPSAPVMPEPVEKEKGHVLEEKIEETLGLADFAEKDVEEEKSPIEKEFAASEETIIQDSGLSKIEESFRMPEEKEDILHIGEEQAEAKKEEGSLWEMPSEKEEDISFEEPIKAPEAKKKEKAEEAFPFKAEDAKAQAGKSDEGNVPVYEISDEELISFPTDLIQSDEEMVYEAKKKEDEIISLDISPKEKVSAQPEKAKEPSQGEDMIIIEEPEEELLSLETPIPEIRVAPPKAEFEEGVLSVEEIKIETPSFEEAEAPKAEAAGREELATETLAELYIKQGFYDKGIEIYHKLLEADPKNSVLNQKLKDAITLSNLLAGGQKKGKDYEEIIPGVTIEKTGTEVENIEIVEIPPQKAEAAKERVVIPKPTVERPIEEAKKPEPPKTAEAHPKVPKQKAKIQRLQSWLENVKKG